MAVGCTREGTSKGRCSLHSTHAVRHDVELRAHKFARGHASHTPLAANSPYSLCLGVSRAWATRGASHHPYGSRYGAVHATAALIASGVARVRGGASAEPPRRTRATPPPCRPGWGRHIPAPRKHIALRREQNIRDVGQMRTCYCAIQLHAGRLYPSSNRNPNLF